MLFLYAGHLCHLFIKVSRWNTISREKEGEKVTEIKKERKNEKESERIQRNERTDEPTKGRQTNR